jgi:hypothetical protein
MKADRAKAAPAWRPRARVIIIGRPPDGWL